MIYAYLVFARKIVQCEVVYDVVYECDLRQKFAL